jgi:hypothetical protein
MRWQNLDPRNRKFQKMNDETCYITVSYFLFRLCLIQHTPWYSFMLRICWGQQTFITRFALLAFWRRTIRPWNLDSLWFATQEVEKRFSRVH